LLQTRFPGNWFLVWRDITCATNERTSISTIIPNFPCAHTLSLVDSISSSNALFLLSVLNSFVFDYSARQKVSGTHLNHGIWKQLPILNPLSILQKSLCLTSYQEDTKNSGLIGWIQNRVLELTFTAWDLAQFSYDCGWDGPPFRWDEERRFQIRCELDAAFFHLYLPADEQGRWKPARVADGAVRDETPEELATLEKAFPTPRDAVAFIMETFPIVKRKDEAAHGHYRTKDRILEIYDAMQQAIITGVPYQSPLNPPPGPPTDENGNFLSYSQINPADYPHIHPAKQ